MKLIVNKCKVMHIRTVTIAKPIKKTAQNFLKATKKKTWEQLVIPIKTSWLHWKIVVTLFNVFVRPHFEQCVQFWSPYHRKNITKVERVQRKATKLIPRLQKQAKIGTTKGTQFYRLWKCRLLGDLSDAFKMFSGFDNVNISDCLADDVESGTGSNDFKVFWNVVG